MLEINNFILGPVQTNTFLLWDTKTKQAVVIDPAWDGQIIARQIQNLRLTLEVVWLTHAHFDHFAGVASLYAELDVQQPVALHPDDLPLWKLYGGAPLFGMRIDRGPEPGILLQHGQILNIGNYRFQVRHSPGHTPGHVIFYSQEEQLVFCGDVIFGGSIGRTDLPGGNYAQLMKSINEQIMSLPDETRLLCGHGPETTVGLERLENPFLIS